MKLIKPDYNNSLVNISNSILKYYGIKPLHAPLKELDEYLKRDYKNIIFIVYDGFGSNLMTKNLSDDSFLNKHRIKDITSVFPATTTAALTSLLTGTTPIEHCWLGWDVYIKSIDKIVTLYQNTEKGKEEPLADYSIAQKEFPYISIIDRINEANENIKTYEVSPHGGIIYEADKIDDMYQRILELATHPEKKFIYAYCNEPDFSMHKYGTDNDKVLEVMKALNQKTEEFCNKLTDTLIIITADHGHVTVSDYVILSDYPKLQKMLIRETSIEHRATNFFVKEDMLEAFKEEFNKLFKNDFLLLSKQEVLEQGLFGKAKPHDKFASCLGDYIAIAISDKGIEDKYDPKPLKGLHAGITEDEMTVPLIVIDKR